MRAEYLTVEQWRTIAIACTLLVPLSVYFVGRHLKSSLLAFGLMALLGAGTILLGTGQRGNTGYEALVLYTAAVLPLAVLILPFRPVVVAAQQKETAGEEYELSLREKWMLYSYATLVFVLAGFAAFWILAE
ncbi:hypothetical protein ACFWTE_16965 [Nocardiopsis sp. NPDC058631]|uniref:hypothetical protein n=1 Tax=Nocardiopsis sp. NPDC058631 TaxID=3346566 RepID=UPI003648A791